MSDQQQLPDLQNSSDIRGIALDRVGVTNIKFPIKVGVPTVLPPTDFQHNPDAPFDTIVLKEVSATVDLFVGLPAHFKGANLSRFMRTLVAFEYEGMNVPEMGNLLKRLCERLESADAYARFEFDYYVERLAPVSKIAAPQAYRCAFTGIRKGTAPLEFITEVSVTAASLCPCSRGMSLLPQLAKDRYSDIKGRVKGIPIVGENAEGTPLYFDMDDLVNKVGMGAHNQRSKICARVTTHNNETIWLEELIDLVERSASAPVFPILKREDEKFVTELAYSNPKFSEDITRDLQIGLEQNKLVDSWAIRVENEESIHPYNVACYQHSDMWKY